VQRIFFFVRRVIFFWCDRLFFHVQWVIPARKSEVYPFAWTGARAATPSMRAKAVTHTFQDEPWTVAAQPQSAHFSPRDALSLLSVLYYRKLCHVAATGGRTAAPHITSNGRPAPCGPDSCAGALSGPTAQFLWQQWRGGRRYILRVCDCHALGPCLGVWRSVFFHEHPYRLLATFCGSVCLVQQEACRGFV